MSEQLRRHFDDLDALVSQTAAARGLPAPYVERDFWVTEVLRAAAVDRVVTMPDGWTAPVTFLFKGGTSLSRVSEDVDLLAVFPEGAATNARHKVLKQVDTDVTAHLGLAKSDVSAGASTTGVKRYTTLPRHRVRRRNQGRRPARTRQPGRHLPRRATRLSVERRAVGVPALSVG